MSSVPDIPIPRSASPGSREPPRKGTFERILEDRRAGKCPVNLALPKVLAHCAFYGIATGKPETLGLPVELTTNK